MKIIICGAGQVGASIARQLSNEDNDVSVLDQSPELIRHISDTVDVKARVGNASHPTALKEIGADEADMIIAVTQSDEVNMVACQVAHSLFNVPTKIARIRHQNFLQPEWNHLYRHDHLPIDHIISPEIEVANNIIHRLHVPGAMDTIPFAGGVLKVVSMRTTLDCPFVNMNVTHVQKKMTDLKVSILGVLRQDDFLLAHDDLEMMVDDELFFASDSKDVQKAMTILGHEEKEAHRVAIIGAGNIGLYLAEHLEKEEVDVRVKLIEIDKDRAEVAAERLDRITVINGDALSQEILDEANVSSVETFIAVSNDDEVNILASLLAKRFGCQRAVTLVSNTTSYGPLIASLGIDVIINPREITVSSILQYVRKGQILSARSICKGKAEIIEAEALPSSPVVGKTFGEIALPAEVIVGALIRKKQVIIPKDDTVIEAADHIVLVSQRNTVKQIERIFSVKFEFF